MAEDTEIRLHLDRPTIPGDGSPAVIRHGLTVEGWAVAADGIESLDIEIDGEPAGPALYGIRRPDIAALFAGWQGADAGGFTLMLPAGSLAEGRHEIRVTATANSGRGAETVFPIAVYSAGIGGPTVLRRKVPLAETQLAERVLAGLAWRPVFGLLLGIGEIDAEVAAARQTLASLREQAYPEWQVTVLRRGRALPADLPRRLLDGFDDIVGRIALRLDAPPAAPLAELAAAPGGRQPSLVGVLLAGDILGADALLAMAVGSGLRSEAELFYADERRVNPANGRWEAFFKPEWSPELLTATNYIGRFWCALSNVYSRARATAGDWLQYGDYDLILRCTEAASDIARIPELLCQRGRAQLDHPEQERAALRRALARREVSGEVRDGFGEGYYRLRRAPIGEGLVSIVIPTCASRGLIETCIETLRAKTRYRHFEIVCVENIPRSEARWKDWIKQHADTVVSAKPPFNWSRFNNLGAARAKGQYLLFLNDDTEIVDPDWLDALLEHAARPEIGVVGARLLYPDRSVQHAGLFWTPQGGRHAFRRAAETDPGYFGLSLSERNVIAVTGACFMVRRGEFEAQGGFDEAHDIVNNDVDYCLRAWERGKRVVYTPHAVLIHHELASRYDLGDEFDREAFARRWRRRLGSRDGFHHLHLSLHHDDYAYEAEPLELLHSSRPLFGRDAIRDILAVKLDHIGDFVLTVPALQRLRELFPEARLHLLSAPGSAALAGLVPELVSVTQFDFFHERSELGQRELTQKDLAGLRERLESRRFDLAIDFRKHPETRPILQLSGARWLAGFDRHNQFPWLDIVAEWEEDPAGIRKQSHVGDDLIRLAEAVALATRPAASLRLESAPENERQPGSRHAPRRRVAVHPGVGTPIRQWPTAHYAALIDLLIAAHDLDIVLIGSPDEAAIAEEVMRLVRNPASVRSVAGELALKDLPALLAGSALFIGNNSGPKHIAAGLGVPTVSIESGTVDPREWGPSGANAIAVRRAMLCSPCYLSDPGMCWRGLACLTELRPPEIYEICARLLAIPAA